MGQGFLLKDQMLSVAIVVNTLDTGLENWSMFRSILSFVLTNGPLSNWKKKTSKHFLFENLYDNVKRSYRNKKETFSAEIFCCLCWYNAFENLYETFKSIETRKTEKSLALSSDIVDFHLKTAEADSPTFSWGNWQRLWFSKSKVWPMKNYKKTYSKIWEKCFVTT